MGQNTEGGALLLERWPEYQERSVHLVVLELLSMNCEIIVILKKTLLEMPRLI